MNKLLAHVVAHESYEGLSRVTLTCHEEHFTSLLIDIESLGAITKEDSFWILFKENEVMLASKESDVSASNAFVSEVVSIKEGRVLSEVVLNFHGAKISSIITTASLQRLGIAEKKEFLWFVKANEITLQRKRDV
jgi:molybdopterin-binding protein